VHQCFVACEEPSVSRDGIFVVVPTCASSCPITYTIMLLMLVLNVIIKFAVGSTQNTGAPFDSHDKISWNAVWVAETTHGRLPMKMAAHFMFQSVQSFIRETDLY